jgi:hypothetical protein
MSPKAGSKPVVIDANVLLAFYLPAEPHQTRPPTSPLRYRTAPGADRLPSGAVVGAASDIALRRSCATSLSCSERR